MKPVFLLFIFLAGCSSLRLRPVNPDHAARKLEVTRTLSTDEGSLDAALKAAQDECDHLDNKVTGLTVTSIGLGVLNGGSGLVALLTDSTPRLVTGGIALGLATLGPIFAYLTTHYSQTYSHRCTVNTGGR